jgi:hypothetical protein
MKILISDAENRKTFDIVNIVSRYYSRKDLLIASNEQGYLLKKIYSGLIKLCTTHYLAFENDLKEILAGIPSTNEPIIYIPIEEATTLYFYHFVEKNKYFKNRFLFLLPALQAFNLSRNKYGLNLFCKENNIAAPDIITKDECQLQNNFKPLIYKPKTGTGSKGIRIVKTKEELACIQWNNDYFLQYFVGDGVTVDGGFYLMNQGQLISFYSHQRIRTYPPSGGVSVFSKSTPNDRIKEIGTTLLNKLNWSGWAMIEFIYDKESDQYKLIEINPRAWGSILLSEINQSFFIQKYIQLAMGLEVKQMPVNNDTYIRWLIPWDAILYLRKLGNIKHFWQFNIKKTAYIGFSYANIFKSILFILFSSMNFQHLKKIVKGKK